MRYQKRISGPLIDRIHIHVAVRRGTYDTLAVARQGERFKHTCLLTS
jgi:predicted ATPase with chaperone activity